MSWCEREIGEGELKLLRLVSLIGVLIVLMSEKLELLLELLLGAGRHEFFFQNAILFEEKFVEVNKNEETSSNRLMFSNKFINNP